MSPGCNAFFSSRPAKQVIHAGTPGTGAASRAGQASVGHTRSLYGKIGASLCESPAHACINDSTIGKTRKTRPREGDDHSVTGAGMRGSRASRPLPAAGAAGCGDVCGPKPGPHPRRGRPQAGPRPDTFPAAPASPPAHGPCPTPGLREVRGCWGPQTPGHTPPPGRPPGGARPDTFPAAPPAPHTGHAPRRGCGKRGDVGALNAGPHPPAGAAHRRGAAQYLPGSPGSPAPWSGRGP